MLYSFPSGLGSTGAAVASLTELAAFGSYSFTFGSTGKYAVDILNSSSVVVWSGYVNVTNTTGTYLCDISPNAARMLFDGAGYLESDAMAINGTLTGSGSSLIQNNITIPAPVAMASQVAGQIMCLRGDTLSVALPLMGDLTSRTKLIMTAKLSVNDPDDQAILQVIETIGLVVLHGASTTMTASASLTVMNATTGAVTLMIDAAVTCLLAIQDLVWDTQAYLARGIVTPIGGAFSVIGDVTRTVT